MSKFTSFIREKQYLQNVSDNTVRWYKHALKWLPSENPDEAELREMIIRMREAGLKATGANAALRAINVYLHWHSGLDGKCSSACKHPKVRQLKEPQQVMPTFTADQVKLLISYRPQTDFQKRLHLLVMILFDTGCRISEALGIRGSDIDMENLLITLHGKGDKDRKVPMSFELRKAIFKYQGDNAGRLFSTSTGSPWKRMGALRAVKIHCRNLGFEPPARTLHAARHTFGANYIRKTGSLLHLQKMLGHSSLEMSRRYANLCTADLQDVHQRVSLLS
jgi:integrase/recombinase XerD